MNSTEYQVVSVGDDNEPVVFHATFAACAPDGSALTYQLPETGEMTGPQDAALACARALHNIDGERVVVRCIHTVVVRVFG